MLKIIFLFCSLYVVLIGLIVALVLVTIIALCILCRYVIYPHWRNRRPRYSRLRSYRKKKPNSSSSLPRSVASFKRKSITKERYEKQQVLESSDCNSPNIALTEFTFESSCSKFENTLVDIHREYQQQPVKGLLTKQHKRKFKSEPVLHREYSTSKESLSIPLNSSMFKKTSMVSLDSER